jgi:hypothetical protein
MKKLGMIFLLASLLVTTAFSLGSCKKAGTNENENANMEESIPIVYDYVFYEDVDPSLREDDIWIDCYYCRQGFPNHYPDNRLYKCDHNLEFENQAFLCDEHSHLHFFEATDNCTPPGQTQPYFCEYKGQRKHMHILTYTSRYFFNGWHLGGGAGSE